MTVWDMPDHGGGGGGAHPAAVGCYAAFGHLKANHNHSNLPSGVVLKLSYCTAIARYVLCVMMHSAVSVMLSL